jgi:hypothetical protein
MAFATCSAREVITPLLKIRAAGVFIEFMNTPATTNQHQQFPFGDFASSLYIPRKL